MTDYIALSDQLFDMVQAADHQAKKDGHIPLPKKAVREKEIWEHDIPGVEFLPSEIGYFTVRLTPDAAKVMVKAMMAPRC
ncbi:hypothetical protein [Sulfitobacter guttiformis]|nr:hypothetical protein [Sulfitobacter guttiformis]